MKHVLALMLASTFLLTGCQSLSNPEPDGWLSSNEPASSESAGSNAVLLSAQHCLSEYLKEQRRVHYGPCLKIITVNGNTPAVRDDGFIELPAATAVNLGTSCVYRHADGSPIPATLELTDFSITPGMLTKPGQRWYLHAHKQARQVIGCQPTLSRSQSPTFGTE